jgi:hypothetical protein
LLTLLAGAATFALAARTCVSLTAWRCHHHYHLLRGQCQTQQERNLWERWTAGLSNTTTCTTHLLGIVVVGQWLRHGLRGRRVAGKRQERLCKSHTSHSAEPGPSLCRSCTTADATRWNHSHLFVTWFAFENHIQRLLIYRQPMHLTIRDSRDKHM